VTLSASPAGTTLGATTGVTDANGQFTTTLTAPNTATAGVRTVTATSGPLSASDTVNVVRDFDQLVPSSPAASTNNVGPNSQLFLDITVRTDGPGIPPDTVAAVRVPTAYNNAAATGTLVANTANTNGWTIIGSYPDGGWDVYLFRAPTNAVGTQVLRFRHQVSANVPRPSSYAIDARSVEQTGDRNVANNTWASGTQIFTN
jgi:hypothetical protein